MKHGLLVEDDDVYAATLKRALERRDFSIVIATGGDSALRAIAVQAPDFILLDLKLEHESGLALIAPLRAACPSTYLVLVTGYASVATAVEAIKRGADDYLAKPVSVTALLRMLANESSSIDESEAVMTPLSRIEWEHIQQALLDCDGNVSAAARLLGMHRRTLQRKLGKRPGGEFPGNG